VVEHLNAGRTHRHVIWSRIVRSTTTVVTPDHHEEYQQHARILAGTP